MHFHLLLLFLLSVKKSQEYEEKCLYSSSKTLCQRAASTHERLDKIVINCELWLDDSIYQHRIFWPRNAPSVEFHNCPVEAVLAIVRRSHAEKFRNLSFVSLVRSEAEPRWRCDDKLRDLAVVNVSRSDSLDGVAPLLTCPRVRQLVLSWNNLKDLDPSILNNVTSLNKLDLSNNNIVSLHSQIFNKNTKLSHLNLNNNSISSLKRRVFKGLKNLQLLDLSHNDLSSKWLNANVFHDLIHLKLLDLSWNRLNHLDHKLFTNVKHLTHLHLDHNLIRSLSGSPFTSQSELEVLSLSHNQVHNLHHSSFPGLGGNLQSLSLSHNEIRSIHRDSFDDLTGLRSLLLNENKLNLIPDSIQVLNELTILDVGGNEINHLDENCLTNKSQLRILRLEGNEIRNIPHNLLNSTPNLEDLNLSRNQIASLDPQTLSFVPKLVVLRLDQNSLSDINGLLTSHPSLHTLTASNNKLKWFDVAFFPQTLHHLDLHRNQIEELSNYYNIKNGSQLVYLDVSSNIISGVHYHSFMESLENINLANNKISDIASGTFDGLLNLTRVDLRNNLIKSLTVNALKVSAQADSASFYLSGNPLECNCLTSWLVDTSVSSSVVDLALLDCSLSTARQPGRVGLHEATEFLCQYNTHCFSLCRCCSFFACDCRMKCPGQCTCFHNQAWSINMIECGSSNLSSVPAQVPMDSTSLFLDDNQLLNIGPETFIGRNKLLSLFLNHSRIMSLHSKSFLGLTQLTKLHLDHNHLSVLEGQEFEDLSKLLSLFLDNNQLKYIGNETFLPLVNLLELSLHGNQLLELDALGQLENLKTASLGSNPWKCQCQFVMELDNLSGLVISDYSQLMCTQNSHVTTLEALSSSCKDLDVMAVSAESTSSILTIFISVLLVIILIIAITIVIALRRSISNWIYSNTDNSITHCPVPDAKQYSAYLHYCMKDHEFVNQVFSPKLEGIGHRLCLHHRDLVPRTTVGEAISQAVKSSHSLIILTSNAYFESDIPSYELQLILSDLLPHVHVTVVVMEGKLSKVRNSLEQLGGDQVNGWKLIKLADKSFWSKLQVLLPNNRNQWNSETSSCSTRSTLVNSRGTPVNFGDLSVNTGDGKNGSRKEIRLTDNPLDQIPYPDILLHQKQEQHLYSTLNHSKKFFDPQEKIEREFSKNIPSHQNYLSETLKNQQGQFSESDLLLKKPVSPFGRRHYSSEESNIICDVSHANNFRENDNFESPDRTIYEDDNSIYIDKNLHLVATLKSTFID